jgi:phosphoribosyl 1,2-cyclic phosphodiesterase
MMRVKFFGVRGSIATAGDETRRYGGNTSCVMVQAAGETLIFDAGTGIRKLGADLLRDGQKSAHLFFSHLHWDHIQGFPFFTPAYVPGNALSVYGVNTENYAPDDDAQDPTTLQLSIASGAPVADIDPAKGVRAAMAAQMTAPNFPVGLDTMRGDLRFIDVPYGERIVVAGKLGTPEALVVRHTAVDHPNGCVAYRVDHGGKSVVYATDLELAEGTDGAVFDSLVELARNADLLVFDAMYTPEEYEGSRGMSRKGWGHSTFEMGAALAECARIKELALFHHDPAHDDTFMDTLGERARARFSPTLVAREGLELVL